ncbi:triphosphoribosyl-dephospho-CoA synthase CitG [Orbus mooreae]|uniref:triphosphoribosyl-dephospho-CoA synthase CitG n=1 Tax=Orbus mooreae TaxID=3074107 RepID=UPI00370D1FD8
MNYNLAQQTFFDSDDIYACQYAAAKAAQMALLKEVCLSPKPGLVDINNCGSHRDMDLNTFMRSISAISPWLDQFYLYGKSITVAGKFLPNLRPLGIQCEQSMFKATNNVNTHKGGVFAFGLLLAAIGKLDNDQIALSYQAICDEVAKACQGLVQQELETRNSATTVGEKLFKQHRLTGARGEAESGYLTVRNISLPIFKEMMITGHDEETSLLQAMLYLLAYNDDTNLVSRGGMAGLQYVQDAAKSIIAIGGMIQQGGKQKLLELDQQLIKRNLSPGGTADLIAITWFLSQFN